MNAYLKVTSYLLPADRSALIACLWHNGPHSDNIHVNPERPSEITYLIDWQSSHVALLLMHASHPSFPRIKGPKPKETDMSQPVHCNLPLKTISLR